MSQVSAHDTRLAAVENANAARDADIADLQARNDYDITVATTADIDAIFATASY